MTNFTIRLADDQHARLKALAARRGISLNKLFEEMSAKVISEFDAEARYRARAARGSAEDARAVLDTLDRYYEAGRRDT